MVHFSLGSEKFNVIRAPWWDEKFERMVGLVKQSLYKANGYANLNLNELEEILLEIEINLNNHPLTYQEDDTAFPVLTPNSLIHGQPTTLPEEDYIQKMKKKQIGKDEEEISKNVKFPYGIGGTLCICEH